jgi:hypothetical protein
MADNEKTPWPKAQEVRRARYVALAYIRRRRVLRNDIP